MDSGFLGEWGAEGSLWKDATPRGGGGQDTHEVMAISTSMRERGIQSPKQQNTDTTWERSRKRFKEGDFVLTLLNLL